MVSVSCELCEVRQRALRRADHSSRWFLSSVVCLSVVVKPRQWGGPGPLGTVASWVGKKNYRNTVCNCICIHTNFVTCPMTHWQSQHLFVVVLKFRLRHPRLFYYIFQNANVLVISRFQWLILLKGKSHKTFSIIVFTKFVFFKFWFKGRGFGLLQPGRFPAPFVVPPTIEGKYTIWLENKGEEEVILTPCPIWLAWSVTIKWLNIVVTWH